MPRILLADDDQTTRDLVSRALIAGGHDVTIAHDGLEALEYLSRTEAFDALVTDVHMPGLDGISLTVKARAGNPSLRVLLMSGFPEELVKAKAAAAGVGVISKPFSLDALKSAIKALLA